MQLQNCEKPVTMIIVLISTCTIFLVPFASAPNCAVFRGDDLGSLTSFESYGLVLAALTFSRHGISGVDDVFIVDNNIVCLAQGSTRDTYRMVSAIVRYRINGGSTTFTQQFHFECSISSGTAVWGFRVLGNFDNSVAGTALVGSFTTPLRTDCRICADTVSGFSAAEHCVGKCNDTLL